MTKTIGIIGFGSFGKFLAEKLSTDYNIRVYSQSGQTGELIAGLATVASSSYLVLAIPLDAYEGVLNEIKPLISKSTVVVDVCSVKVQPMSCIAKLLPGQPTVATHPLFGPESANIDLAGHTMVFCPELSDPDALRDVVGMAEMLKLRVINMSADDHDREMALLQGLTFFIAHALKDLKLHEQKLSTPSFDKLLQLAKLEQNHSIELFQTIQQGNVFTDTIRREFINKCMKLDKSILNISPN